MPAQLFLMIGATDAREIQGRRASPGRSPACALGAAGPAGDAGAAGPGAGAGVAELALELACCEEPQA